MEKGLNGLKLYGRGSIKGYSKGKSSFLIGIVLNPDVKMIVISSDKETFLKHFFHTIYIIIIYELFKNYLKKYWSCYMIYDTFSMKM